MEILSPVGNMEYIKIAIKNNVDAVYGGFKLFNARNRAVNFTLEEYNEAIRLAHENGIKFYLTVNVLLIDQELEDLMDLLQSGKVILPDAFIAADIGLITRLYETFPHIAIHLSTQFGCHNIYDVNYAATLHTSRVILSRELTQKEIRSITAKSPIEIECFCWGSQCVSFSGMCFWGALLNGGGGNNGKCLIPCRDTYQVGKQYGNLMYLTDLNCINEIKKIDGVGSYKIEGRRRPFKEVEAAILQVKQGTNESENGFVFGTNQKDNRLLQTINKRLKPVCQAKAIIPDRYDKFAIFKGGKPERYCDYEQREDCYYIYSGLFQKYNLNQVNISFYFSIKNGFITDTSYTNHKGDEIIFHSKEDDKILFQPDEFVAMVNRISSKINVNSIIYIKDSTEEIHISKKLVDEIIGYIIRTLYTKEMPKNQNSINNITIETNEEAVIDDLLVNGDDDLILNLDSVAKLKRIDYYITKYSHECERIIYKLPVFNWEGEDLLPYYKKLEHRSVMFTRLAQLHLTKELDFKQRLIDYTVYLWNKEAVDYISQFNIDIMTASIELDYNVNHSLYGNKKVQYIIGGKLPLIFSRNCFSSLFDCQCNKTTKKWIHNHDKDLDFELICNEDYKFLVTKEIMINNYIRNNNNESYRYMAYGQDISEIHKNIKALKQSDYYKVFEVAKDKFYSLR